MLGRVVLVGVAWCRVLLRSAAVGSVTVSSVTVSSVAVSSIVLVGSVLAGSVVERKMWSRATSRGRAVLGGWRWGQRRRWMWRQKSLSVLLLDARCGLLRGPSIQIANVGIGIASVGDRFT